MNAELFSGFSSSRDHFEGFCGKAQDRSRSLFLLEKRQKDFCSRDSESSVFRACKILHEYMHPNGIIAEVPDLRGLGSLAAVNTERGCERPRDDRKTI